MGTNIKRWTDFYSIVLAKMGIVVSSLMERYCVEKTRTTIQLNKSLEGINKIPQYKENVLHYQERNGPRGKCGKMKVNLRIWYRHRTKECQKNSVGYFEDWTGGNKNCHHLKKLVSSSLTSVRLWDTVSAQVKNLR